VFFFITYDLGGDRVPGGISRPRGDLEESPNDFFSFLASGGFGQGSAVVKNKKEKKKE
jgi:hypothetical protein